MPHLARPRTRARTLTGAVALASAAAVLSTLAVGTTSVAAKPPAGPPDTTALAGALADQTLTWEDCDFTLDGQPELEELLENWPTLECADVTVPLDWHDPQNGETLKIRINRVTNLSQSSPAYKGTLLVNPGGPGGEALVWAPNILRRAPQLSASYNTIGIDPRGVGQSQKPSCPFKVDPFNDPIKVYLKAKATACSTNHQVDKITTEQTAYDFDFVRGLLDIPSITYIGYSYGTWLGTWYGTLFGPRIDRMILDSSINGLDETLQPAWDLQPIARNRQFVDAMIPYATRENQRLLEQGEPGVEILEKLPTDPAELERLYFAGQQAYIDLGYGDSLIYAWIDAMGAFGDPSQYPLTTEVIDSFALLALQLEELGITPEEAIANVPQLADLEARLGQTGVQRANATLEAVSPLVSEADRAAAQTAINTWSQGADTDPGDDPEFPPFNPEFPGMEITFEGYDPFDAVRCGDGQWTQGEAYWDQWSTDIVADNPFQAVFGSLLYPTCAFWPSDNPSKPAVDKRTFPQTLVIQGEEDSQTGYEGGLSTGTKLPNTRFLAVDNGTKHGYFPYGTACVDQPGFAFLDRGTLPNKPVTLCLAKPLPHDTRTFEMWSPINANGKHAPIGSGVPSKVSDPQTGNWDDLVSTSETQALDQRLRTLAPFADNG